MDNFSAVVAGNPWISVHSHNRLSIQSQRYGQGALHRGSIRQEAVDQPVRINALDANITIVVIDMVIGHELLRLHDSVLQIRAVGIPGHIGMHNDAVGAARSLKAATRWYFYAH